MEAAAFIKPDFIVNVVPNLDGDITGIFAGNWVSAWQAATRLVDDIFGVTIREQADIVIASAGGYPKDINLYQAQKTIDNAIYAMKPGGCIILLAECPDIKEPGEFFDWFNYPTFIGNGEGSAGELSDLGLGGRAAAGVWPAGRDHHGYPQRKYRPGAQGRRPGCGLHVGGPENSV